MHPESDTVERGNTATFRCQIKNCDECIIRWRIQDIQTREWVSVIAEDVVTVPDPDRDDRLTSTLSIVATNSSVVQCQEFNDGAIKRIDRNRYSKYAILYVPEDTGMCATQVLICGN